MPLTLKLLAGLAGTIITVFTNHCCFRNVLLRCRRRWWLRGGRLHPQWRLGRGLCPASGTRHVCGSRGATLVVTFYRSWVKEKVFESHHFSHVKNAVSRFITRYKKYFYPGNRNWRDTMLCFAMISRRWNWLLRLMLLKKMNLYLLCGVEARG